MDDLQPGKRYLASPPGGMPGKVEVTYRGPAPPRWLSEGGGESYVEQVELERDGQVYVTLRDSIEPLPAHGASDADSRGGCASDRS